MKVVILFNIPLWIPNMSLISPVSEELEITLIRFKNMSQIWVFNIGYRTVPAPLLWFRHEESCLKTENVNLCPRIS